MWRNGIRVGLKNLWGQPLVGSNPTSPTGINYKVIYELVKMRASALIAYLEIFFTSQAENIPITAPANISKGQWTPT